MAEEREDQTNTNQATDRQNGSGQQEAQQSSATRPTMSDQGNEGSFGGQSSGRESTSLGKQSGQPIGGDDSNTGSGTTLSQGAEFDEKNSSENSGMKDQSGAKTSEEGFIGSKAESRSDSSNQDRKDRDASESDSSEFGSQNLSDASGS